MSEGNYDEFYEAVLKYTKSAGEMIREKIALKKDFKQKSGEIDLVTETDQAVEKFLVDNLHRDFPDHFFIGEETAKDEAGSNMTEAPTWIIDPIDGTMNFVHGFPHSCISIALFIKCRPVIGIIYNPVIEQLFTARRGKGAYLNERKIHVSDQTDLEKALVMMEFGTSRDAKKMEVNNLNMNALMNHVHGLRALGSAALDMAMVALGAADAYFEFGIHIWDIAAGELLVEEAGGVILDPANQPLNRTSRRVLAAGTAELAQKLSEKLTQFYPTPTD